MSANNKYLVIGRNSVSVLMKTLSGYELVPTPNENMKNFKAMIDIQHSFNHDFVVIEETSGDAVKYSINLEETGRTKGSGRLSCNLSITQTPNIQQALASFNPTAVCRCAVTIPSQ